MKKNSFNRFGFIVAISALSLVLGFPGQARAAMEDGCDGFPIHHKVVGGQTPKTFRPSETYWALSQKYYGSSRYHDVIALETQIAPKLLQVGDDIVIPCLDEKNSEGETWRATYAKLDGPKASQQADSNDPDADLIKIAESLKFTEAGDPILPDEVPQVAVPQIVAPAVESVETPATPVVVDSSEPAPADDTPSGESSSRWAEATPPAPVTPVPPPPPYRLLDPDPTIFAVAVMPPAEVSPESSSDNEEATKVVPNAPAVSVNTETLSMSSQVQPMTTIDIWPSSAKKKSHFSVIGRMFAAIVHLPRRVFSKEIPVPAPPPAQTPAVPNQAPTVADASARK